MDTAQVLTKPEQVTPFYSKTVDGQTFNFAQPSYKDIDRYREQGVIEGAVWLTNRVVTEESKSAWQGRTQIGPESDGDLLLGVTQEILERLGIR